MAQLVVSFVLIVVFNDVCFGVGWNPSNFSFNPGESYELVWQDEFENVGPARAVINGEPAYAPNPKNWAHRTGLHVDGGTQNYTDSIYNAYVQDNHLTIVALREGYTSAMLESKRLQEFTFGIWAAKFRLPYGQDIWPAWYLLGNADIYNLSWPTNGEYDIVEMIGGNKRVNVTDQFAHGTIHWNNQSNTMNPVFSKQIHTEWATPDGSMLHNNSLIYWFEWTPTSISIGVNEFVYSQLNTINLPESINPVWPLRGIWPFYMILNVAIGGSWPGPPDNTTVWPQQMTVDWVRVYQKRNDNFDK